jgi:hypothetical protein
LGVSPEQRRDVRKRGGEKRITLRQNALREIEMKKPALIGYTYSSIMGEERGIGVYCETKD